MPDHEKHLAYLAKFMRLMSNQWASEYPDAIEWALAEIDRLRQEIAAREDGAQREIDRLRKAVAELNAELADMQPME